MLSEDEPEGRIKESLPSFEDPAGQWIRRDTMVTLISSAPVSE
jgi:hypothetical protein